VQLCAVWVCNIFTLRILSEKDPMKNTKITGFENFIFYKGQPT